MMQTHGSPSSQTLVSGARVLVVEARFYEDISHELLKGALHALEMAGAVTDVLTVSGALEIPGTAIIALEAADERGNPYEAIVALGCVIRGETGHYDIVAGESARGLMDLSTGMSVAVGNGILTVETVEQAMERADTTRMNKGGEAALAALSVVRIKRSLSLEHAS